MRAFTAILALAATSLALAACDSPEHVDGVAAPVTTTSPAATASTSAVPTSSPTATATTVKPTATVDAEPTATAKASATAPPRDTNPCPVSAAVLYKALRADKDMSARTKPTVALKDETCYQGYATAITIVEGKNVQPAGVLFEYDTEARTWRPLNLGSGGYCEGYTSAAVSKRLGNGC
ncbi:hypothetical protein [Paractinoplanes atraurantiacus]|uniref:Uncharacterized protein n=1 Tax=Paractinoplanes atraurantiacus TaxID=1036182 RepID=A0A285ILQ1_9ACTN|nr:hypothetical protein [Actinoplanes atraurantiacus]SNY48813.1 hypothetical protein SAMN05421748_109119 [Actinoplanes atraurantiacus]